MFNREAALQSCAEKFAGVEAGILRAGFGIFVGVAGDALKFRKAVTLERAQKLLVGEVCGCRFRHVDALSFGG